MTKMIDRIEGKNRPPPCADVFSFANVNKRASAGGEILSVALRQIEEGGGGWFVGARQRLECMPSLTYDVNEEGGGELLSAYVRRSSMEGRIRVERERGVRDGSVGSGGSGCFSQVAGRMCGIEGGERGRG